MRRLVWFALFLPLAAWSAQAAVIYVDADVVSGTADGTSWADAFIMPPPASAAHNDVVEQVMSCRVLVLMMYFLDPQSSSGGPTKSG